MEEFIHRLAEYAALFAEAVAIFIVAFGCLRALAGVLRVIVKRDATHGARKKIWRGFGGWLLLGLEFELASDIIRSVAAPTWLDLGKLAVIAVIRTFLNYFLERDLEHAGESEERTATPPTTKALRAEPTLAR